MRFFVVSGVVYAANLGVLTPARLGRRREDPGAGDRDRDRHAAELPREQALVVSPLRFAAVALVAVALAPAAHAAGAVHDPAPRRPRRRTDPFHVDVSPPSPRTRRRLTGDEAEQILLHYPKVKAWLERYPAHPTIDASYSKGTWTINVFSGKAGEIATGHGRRRHRLGAHGLDGPAGRLGDGPRRKRRVRRDDDQLLLGLARLLRGLPDRPRRLAAACSRCGTSTC